MNSKEREVLAFAEQLERKYPFDCHARVWRGDYQELLNEFGCDVGEMIRAIEIAEEGRMTRWQDYLTEWRKNGMKGSRPTYLEVQ